MHVAGTNKGKVTKRQQDFDVADILAAAEDTKAEWRRYFKAPKRQPLRMREQDLRARRPICVPINAAVS